MKINEYFVLKDIQDTATIRLTVAINGDKSLNIITSLNRERTCTIGHIHF